MNILVTCPGCRARVVPLALEGESGCCPSCDLAALKRLITADAGGEVGIFDRALRAVAAEHGGVIHQSAMRERIRGRIASKTIGSLYRRAIAAGRIVPEGQDVSDDHAGKNAGRREPRYRLVA